MKTRGFDHIDLRVRDLAAARKFYAQLLPEIVRQAGGRKLEGPQIWREYSPGYYAVFFEDPSGNKLEACARQSLVA